MKTIYPCLLVLFFVTQSKAQLTLTKSANEPVVGDVRTMVRHDSSTAVPKSMGTNQNWNFTSLTHTNSFTEITTYTPVTSVPAGSLFPTATIAAKRGSSNYEYFKSSGSNWEFVGYYDSQDNEQLVLSNTAIFNSWPITLTSTFSDIASGVQTTSSGTAAVTGTLAYIGSGTGTVTFPNGIVENNCLQVISTLTVVMGASTQTQITYNYYSPLRKQPIIEIQYNMESAGTEFSAYVDAIGTVGLGELKSESQKLVLYPIPSSDLLNIRFENGKTPELIEVFDVNGKLLISVHDTHYLDVSTLPQSCYLVRITNDDMVYHRTLPVIKY
jgi:hypothetical protein